MDRIKSYGHEHTGVWMVSWEEIMVMCRHLAERVQAEFQPDAIAGVGRGGAIPATILASMLRLDYFPLTISRRRRDAVAWREPQLFAPPPDLSGRRVLVADEISVSGQSLAAAVTAIRAAGAAAVQTATLYVHSISEKPDFYAVEDDRAFVQPWDYQVLTGGHWQIHPDYVPDLRRFGLLRQTDT